MLKIANYKNTGSNTRLKYKLVVSAYGDEDVDAIEQLFEGHRIGFSYQDHVLTLTQDSSSQYRLGKYEKKPNRRVIGILHSDKSLGTFGSVEVKADWGTKALSMILPDKLEEPIKKTKPRRKRDNGAPVTISLREAVRAVNHHKGELKGDLCLSIDQRGCLRALIEY